MEQNLPERVTRLEAESSAMKQDIAEIKVELKKSATKEDLEELKGFFEQRDQQYNSFLQQYTDNMWKLIFGLLLLFGGLMVVMFGIKEIPKLF